MQDGRTPTHPLFNDSSADIVVESSDRTKFCLHRKNIQVHTGSAFLGGLYCSSVNDPDVTCLTESSSVLEIVFQFLYPQKHPDLSTIQDFESVAAIADAVGKYEIYGAMNACEIRLRSFLPDHATEIFTYAFKHQNEDLVNETALIFSRFPVHERLGSLPPQCIQPWVRYQKLWAALFDVIRIHIKSHLQGASSANGGRCGCGMGRPLYYRNNTQGTICGNCYDSLRVWLFNLEKTNSFAELKTEIARSLAKESVTCRSPHLPEIAKFSQNLIQHVPRFVSFLNFSPKQNPASH